MVIETRAVTEEGNKELERRVRSIVAHSAAMHELEYEVEVIGAAIPLFCDEELVSLAVEEAEKMDDFSSVKGVRNAESLGSEDASFMIQRVQENGGKGTYMVIGADLPAPHHHPQFDIDESVLPTSVDLLYRIAVRVLTVSSEKRHTAGTL